MRCLKCGQDGIAVATEICPNPKCRLHLPTLLRDVLPPLTAVAGGRYQIEYAIGQGGFGITYRALHADLGQRVAIKELFLQDQALRHPGTGSVTVSHSTRPAFEKALVRFLEEGRLLARLNQPNVVQVRDFFKEHETAYLVMEYLSGQTLQAELDTAPGRKLPERRVREVMSALVGALTASHEAGIYHLDIKPENVMVETSGRIVLIDFGASRQGLGTRTTKSYTPGYAPPELMSSGMAIGPQSDVFELGMLLHELLTGKLPPDALSRAFEDDWEPFGVSEPYAGLIREALRLKPEKRPPVVAAWWRGVEAKPPPVVVRRAEPVVKEPVVAAPKAGSVRVNPKDGAEMVFIPAGPFLMGDDDLSDNPRHTVRLSGYWIYKNVVTVKQYLKFCREIGREMPPEPAYGDNRFNPGWSKADHPIVNVSWEDAKAYCDWAGVRLPTEAEWEKAARGTDGRKYPWGDGWDAKKAWCSKRQWGDAGGTTVVGKYGLSPYGLSDMAGNVWQWCSDWYDANYCKSDHGADPSGPPTGDSRVLRGGSWNDYLPVLFRAAARNLLAPAVRFTSFGFRGASGL